MNVEHCKDCCCARSWKALHIDEYTGLSIPEHIKELQDALAGMVGLIQLVAQRDDITEECRIAMRHNHRFEEAVRVLEPRTVESYRCPVHGLIEGETECPRC